MQEHKERGGPYGDRARQLSSTATGWMDSLWDADVRLLRAPDSLPWTHMVRETVWYAVGLLGRAGVGDAERAVEAIEGVLSHQFDAPGSVHHGTWRRHPDEPDPGPYAEEWRDYDPNWREFIGCTLLLTLHEFDLPGSLVRRIDHALDLAVEGSRRRGIEAHYTNIALMAAFLYDDVGERRGVTQLRSTGEDLAREVYRLWSRADAFPEFNSPTYYGVDLFGLGLWRAHAPSPVLRKLGARMEDGLWREIATRYHPGLRNMAGPYDRTYGMDLQKYASLLGMWLVLAGEDRAVPDPAVAGHVHDWAFAPCFALIGARVPDGAAATLRSFGGPRHVLTVLADDPLRTATSWLGEDHMIGAEHGGLRHEWDQFCPVAAHWRAPDGSVNWLRVAPGTRVDATVDERGILHVTHLGPGGPAFLVYAPGADATRLTRFTWELPGLTMAVATPTGCDVAVSGAGDLLRIDCLQGSQLRLKCVPDHRAWPVSLRR